MQVELQNGIKKNKSVKFLGYRILSKGYGYGVNLFTLKFAGNNPNNLHDKIKIREEHNRGREAYSQCFKRSLKHGQAKKSTRWMPWH